MGASLRIKQLRQAKAECFNKLKAITDRIAAENRAMNDEERSQYTALESEFQGHTDELSAVQRQADREREMAGFGDDLPTDPNAEAARRSREQAAAGGQGDDFETFGEHLIAVIRAGLPQNRVIDPRLKAAPTGLNEGVGSDGGFLVATQRVTGIRERMYETGELLRRVTQQPIGEGFNGVKLFGIDETSRADGSRFGGVRVYWTAEAGEKLPSRPKFREMDLRLKKVAGLVYLTDELMQDAVALEGYINRILPQELVFAVENAILYGTGSGMPLGFFNGPGVITVTPSGGAGTITYEDVLAMWSRMWAPSRRNAIWLIDQSIEPQLYQMSQVIGTGGVPVFLPAGGATGQPFASLFGRPIIPHEHGSVLGTAGDIILIDPTQYVLIDKGGIQRASSIHVRFIFDETVLRFVYRVDGMPDWNAPLTPRSGGPTLAPAVILGTRT